MVGGTNNINLTFLQYHSNALSQLQQLSDLPVGCSIDRLNYSGNEPAAATNHPTGRVREPGPVVRHQKLLMCLTNNIHHASTCLRLSCREEICNLSMTCASEAMPFALPDLFSASNSLQIEFDHLKEEFDSRIRLQVLKELQEQQTTSLLHTLEKSVRRKLQEKELEIQNMNHKNKELGERIEQFAFEAQTWQCRARYNESIVDALKTSIQQVNAQATVQVREGCGDSEVSDRDSHTNPTSTRSWNCKLCKQNDVTILLMPCRHMCLCNDCEGLLIFAPSAR